MSVRGLIAVCLLIAVLGAGWHERARLQAWAGAVTLPEPPSSAGDPAGSGGNAKAGSLRKCVKGGEVTYSNVDCPTGAQARAVTGGTVSVVAAPPMPKPSEAASGPTALHKALDITRADTLRDKIMQRQIEGPR